MIKEGLIFQYYEKIYIASYLNREITVDQQTYSFRKIKTRVLVNPVGVDHVNETSIATKERALLDTLYVNVDYQFDNIQDINWEVVFKILPIYGNKRLEKNVNHFYKSVINSSL